MWVVNIKVKWRPFSKSMDNKKMQIRLVVCSYLNDCTHFHKDTNLSPIEDLF